MSAEERALAEIEFTSSNPRYAVSPEALNTRMELWDMGYKNEPRCQTIYIDTVRGPDAFSSCKCVKTPSGSSVAICTANGGFNCIMSAPVVGHNGWTNSDMEKKGIANCGENFPQRDTAPAAGVAIVNESGGKLIVATAAFLLLLLGVWGHLGKRS